MVKDKSAMPLLAVVAIVAVVAVVLLVLQGRTPSSEDAVAGEATRTVKKTYEISAYAVQGTENAEFTVNGLAFALSPEDQLYNLPSGGVLGFDRVVFQDYAGGIRGVDFDLMSVCPSDYAIVAGAVQGAKYDAELNVYSINTRLKPVGKMDTLRLKEGDTARLRDGAKITLVAKQDYAGGLGGTRFEDYAGGLNGVAFKLEC